MGAEGGACHRSVQLVSPGFLPTNSQVLLFGSAMFTICSLLLLSLFVAQSLSPSSKEEDRMQRTAKEKGCCRAGFSPSSLWPRAPGTVRPPPQGPGG